MVFRRSDREREREHKDEDADGLNIISADDEDEEDGEGAEPARLFEEGQPCEICSAEDGRIGLDMTCRGAYDGEPVLFGYNCAPNQLKDAYANLDGVAIVVEPFGDYSAHYYYRLDEMAAYQFVREDIEAISWLLLTIGDACARCGEQSHFAWLTRDFVDRKLPENRAIFRNLDREIEHLCNACASAALSAAYVGLGLPLMTVEMPRSAMGILMPTAD